MEIENALNIRKAIEKQTEKNKEYRRKLQNNLIDLQEDVNQEERRKNHKCKTCFYLRSNLVCSPCVNTTICKICKKPFISFNSDEKVCSNCTIQYDLCRCCGQKIE